MSSSKMIGLTRPYKTSAAYLHTWHWLFWFLWTFWSTNQFRVVLGCYPGMFSYGVTNPASDIYLTSGSELVINCTLNANYTGPGDARNITWLMGSREVSSRYITVLDSRTAQLRIPNMDTSKCEKFTCQLKPNLTLCLNEVMVGDTPPTYGINNFTCLVHEWKSLNCTWQTPPSCVATTWTLHYQKGRGLVKCPEIKEIVKKERYSCKFSDTSDPGYDPLIRTFHFTLNGRNNFGESVSSFSIDHSSIVVLFPPEKLVVSPLSSTELRVNWNSTEGRLNLFPFRVVYWLEYQSEWDTLNHWNQIKNTENMSYHLKNLTPYTNYTIRLRCRTRAAADILKMWSRPIMTTESTLPAAPTAFVNTTSSSFEDATFGMNRRNITIFWQPVKSSEYFGPNFYYHIVVLDEDGVVQEKFENSNSSMTQFSSMKQESFYHFKIRAVNKIGKSDHEAEVFVPQYANKPSDPESFSVILHPSGVYKVKLDYHPTPTAIAVTSYTVFWCKTSRGMCSTPLQWTTVDSHQKVVDVTVQDSTELYRFAVSANGVNTSSGLAWLKCITYYDGVLRKIKMDSTVEGPRSVKVSWTLDCTDRMGIVTGFVIQYCICETSKQLCIDDGLKDVNINESQVSQYTLNDLKPYSNYCIIVSAKDDQQIGEPTNPKVVRTFEAAPDDPPRNIRIVKVTNHSIQLQWDSPEVPNGNSHLYVVHYGTRQQKTTCRETTCNATLTAAIECYTNYSITLEACTLRGCSVHSKPLNVTTDVGVPGQPAAPKVRWINETHVMVDWEEPLKPNGPINKWNLFIMAKMGDEVKNSSKVLRNSSSIISVHCGDDGQTEYHFAIQAIIHKSDNETFVGPYSDVQTLNHCYMRSILDYSLPAIAIGAVIGIMFIVVVMYLLIRTYGAKFQKWREVKVDLPPGLTEGNLGYNGFKKNHMHPSPYYLTENPKSLLTTDRLQSVSSDAGRASQDSGETILHTTSSLSSLHDEILLSEKTDLDGFGHQHNLSSDSSGCSTGAGSISSAATTRLHLSCDSGTEADFPSPRFMPDSVFVDSPLWPAPHIPSIAPNCQLRLRNSNTLQRLGEESTSDTSSGISCNKELENENSDKGIMDPVIKDGIVAVDLDGHYCKAAGFKGHVDSHLARQDQSSFTSGSDAGSMDRGVIGLPYSQVGLSSPFQDVKQPYSTEFAGQEQPKQAGVAALTTETKTPSEVPLTEVFRAGVMDNAQSKLGQSTPYVTVLSEPVIPSRKFGLGYSKVGRTYPSPLGDVQKRVAIGYTIHESEQIGNKLPHQRKGVHPKDDELTRLSTSNSGYVTVGKMDESLQKEYKEDSSNFQVAESLDGELNCSLADQLSDYLADDGRSSWENELEDMTEDDLRSVSTDMSTAPQRGYVCLGSAKLKPSQNYVVLATRPELIAQCTSESQAGDIGREVDSDSNKPYLKVV